MFMSSYHYWNKILILLLNETNRFSINFIVLARSTLDLNARIFRNEK